ncbi:MAG: DNA damage-inducible protein D [Flexibacter sp. CG_4_10_14_3_um_filter_32_15]|nr:MAG: DNA damage-inducible protein D [Flexibacter sp. CG_4_10_14_3_um_filter_32_15]
MNKKQSELLFTRFEQIRNEIEGVEFWSARDLQDILGYARWENFHKSVKKALDSCKNTSKDTENHFREVTKMVDIGSNTKRELKDYALTRYACYLVAQNGDSSKEEIAFAQSYFAVQTRKQELIEKRFLETERVTAREKLTDTEKVLSALVRQKNANFGYIRSTGDKALFGGLSTGQMKEKLDIPTNRPLANYLQTSLIKGKDFAASLTNDSIRANNLNSTQEIAKEHKNNNKEVRGVFLRRGTKPEELPPAEDLKKVKRRIASDTRKLKKGSK